MGFEEGCAGSDAAHEITTSRGSMRSAVDNRERRSSERERERDCTFAECRYVPPSSRFPLAGWPLPLRGFLRRLTSVSGPASSPSKLKKVFFCSSALWNPRFFLPPSSPISQGKGMCAQCLSELVVALTLPSIFPLLLFLFGDCVRDLGCFGFSVFCAWDFWIRVLRVNPPNSLATSGWVPLLWWPLPSRSSIAASI